MALSQIYLKHFRLFKELNLKLSKKTVLSGTNGSGKTTVLEAINFLLEGSSNRTKDNSECITEGKGGFKLGLKGELGSKDLILKATKNLNSRIAFERKKGALKAEKKDLPIVINILASHLRMIEGEPELRRDFFNKTMFHVEHGSKKVYQQYHKALVQRNRALKGRLPEKELTIWTERLNQAGTILNEKSNSFFDKLKKSLLRSFKEKNLEKKIPFLKDIDINFYPGWNREKELESLLSENLQKDKAIGFTSSGPHRFDLIIRIRTKLAKSILSRGQQKLLILLIFLHTESLILKENTSGAIFLIDDIASEMDKFNLEKVLEEITLIKSQAIITTISENIINNRADILSKFKQINLKK
jgi:DNA replication and repair protein RecF